MVGPEPEPPPESWRGDQHPDQSEEPDDQWVPPFVPPVPLEDALMFEVVLPDEPWESIYPPPSVYHLLLEELKRQQEDDGA
jgi:hypothetical protein